MSTPQTKAPAAKIDRVSLDYFGCNADLEYHRGYAEAVLQALNTLPAIAIPNARSIELYDLPATAQASDLTAAAQRVLNECQLTEDRSGFRDDTELLARFALSQNSGQADGGVVEEGMELAFAAAKHYAAWWLYQAAGPYPWKGSPAYQALRAHLTLMARQGVEPLTDAARDVLAERKRQVSVEGWTPKHDDQHRSGAMARAAAAYALAGSSEGRLVGDELEPSIVTRLWPHEWASHWWKPKGTRHNLVRAAALALAEIERIDRASPTSASGEAK